MSAQDPQVKTASFPPEAIFGREAGSYLLIIEGASSSKRLLPTDGVLLVGRAPEADLRFDAASISRRHAQFVLLNGEAHVTDLDSHNGTRVNGDRVEGTRALSSGDVVTMGEVAFVLRYDRPASSRPVDHATLRRRLDEEIERALDHGRTLSVLVVSLGSAEGKSEAGARVAAMLGRSDAVGWAGAAELVALLPERPGEAARAAAQRIIASLSQAVPAVRVGLASFPTDGCDGDTLLSGARAAASIVGPRELGAAGDAAVEHTIGDRTVFAADPAMIRLFDLVRRLAPADLPVLILGETGTGKEHAALAMHHWSRRAHKPLVTLNCAAIPDTLVESELFGYEPGAFSDARTSKPGLLEKASGGTFFLDEVGELSDRVQAKLLRVLEAKRTMRLGDMREREIDLRIVAATNRDLEDDCRRKRFREDLLFRLSGATVNLPPLRHRLREVPILARRFFATACEKMGRPGATLSDSVMRRLSTYSWPGNVRELKNAMEYAAATMASERAELWDLPDRIRRAPDAAAGESLETLMEQVMTAPERISSPEFPAKPLDPPAASSFVPLAEEVRRFEATRLKEALDATGGVKARAAELLGLPIRTFVYKLKQYDLLSKPSGKR
jgi:DNA-binding NtrC family response regulator